MKPASLPRAAGLIILVVVGVAKGQEREPVTLTGLDGTTLRLDLGSVRIDGHLDVREGPRGGPGEGTRLELGALGLQSAEVVSLSMEKPLSQGSDLRVRARYFFLGGSATLDRDVLFNSVRYEGGSQLHTSAPYSDVRVEWRHTVLTLPHDGQLSLLLGADYKYLVVRTRGLRSEDTIGHDRREDFYAQELPLPSAGLSADLPLGRGIWLHGEAFGGSVRGINTLRKEGGTVRLWQTNIESEVGVSFTRLLWRASAGVHYDHLSMNEVSGEDGNEVVLRGIGPYVRVTRRF